MKMDFLGLQLSINDGTKFGDFKSYLPNNYFNVLDDPQRAILIELAKSGGRTDILNYLIMMNRKLKLKDF